MGLTALEATVDGRFLIDSFLHCVSVLLRLLRRRRYEQCKTQEVGGYPISMPPLFQNPITVASGTRAGQ